MSPNREVKVARKHQLVQLGRLFDAVQFTTASFFWDLQVSLLTEHVSALMLGPAASSVQAQRCLHPLFTVAVRACVQSQLLLIPASMCHGECCRLASIKAVNRRSCAGAASEFSSPLPSVIGHTQRENKESGGCRRLEGGESGKQGTKDGKTKIKSLQRKKKELTATQRQRNWSFRQFSNCFIWLLLGSFKTT